VICARIDYRAAVNVGVRESRCQRLLQLVVVIRTTFDRMAQRVAVQLPQARCYCVSKTHRSRARSGRLQRRVGRSGIRRSCATRIRRPHPHRITPARRAVRSGSHAAPNHAQYNGSRTASRPAHNQVAHNGGSAQRAVIPHSAQRAIRIMGARTTSAQRAWARRRGHNRRPSSAIRCIKSKKGKRPRSPDAQRFAVQLPRARRNQLSK
jgi:hypothetical protein